MKIANINNLSLVSVAMERLVTAILPAKVLALLRWVASRLRAVFICLRALQWNVLRIVGVMKMAATASTGSKRTRSI